MSMNMMNMNNPKGNWAMNGPSKVHDFLKRNPNSWFCDDCVEKASGVDRHEVNTIGWTLALFRNEFRRTPTVCSQHCGSRSKIATQAI